MRNAMMKALFELAEENSNIMLLTADLGFGVFEKFSEKFPKQFLNVGVAEQNMIGIASGLALALEDRIVYVYSIANFPTLRCLEQIRNDACYHNLNINILAIGGGFSYGGLGMSHHATEDISIMRALPGIVVVAPCTDWEAGEAVKALAKNPGVGYLRIDKSKSVDSISKKKFSLGKARILRQGHDFSIIATGGIAEEALAAADALLARGIECRIISMHTIKPLDIEIILDAAINTKGILILEENNMVGGLGGAIAEACMDNAIHVDHFIRLGMPDIYSSIVGSQKFLRSYYGISQDVVMNKILKIFGK